MIVVYTRDESGLLERHVYHGMRRETYFAAMSGGIPEQFHPKPTGTEELMGWPETKVEWYGSFGFGTR